MSGDKLILYLTIKRQWFEMIASGEKLEEYREIKDYWTRRLVWRHHDAVHFRNGFRASSPTMMFELLWIDVGNGDPAWGAPVGREVYILRLGKMLQAPAVTEEGP